ncbi:MAG: gamma-glutamyltransferase family protein [Hyphomicrobiaceae bacterium]|nr:gamma-glutamyltransferase family protein [Hyphomicrobiaceae bacterium]
MLETTRARRGMVAAPHHLAAESGLAVLREGGNAIEAMVAAAATIAVVYPHMNGLGGDNFWLVSEAGGAPVGIDACGAAAGLASRDHYRELGHVTAIPGRGAHAALTMAGAVSGWQAALERSARWGGRLPLARLLADAIAYARDGFPVTATQVKNNIGKRAELETVAGFAETFMPQATHPALGSLFRNPRLAATLERLAAAGLDDFYRGDLARQMARELEAAGSPLRLADFERHHALAVSPLAVRLTHGTAYGMPPPTQGLASMMILGLYERLGVAEAEGFAHVHGLVEATKQAFMIRDAHVTDPAYMTVDPAAYLAPAALDARASRIDRARALPWPQTAKPGDTVWLGAIDGEGRAVSFIQSVYWEFGSGLVLPGSGITWQNRGTSFSLDPAKQNALEPLRRPFHTIQPALAVLDDGRVMPYGTMGGEGQPQTQAAIYTRHVVYGQDLQAAIAAPRWLLGRTWGSEATNLRIENRFAPDVVAALAGAGHDIEVIGPFEEAMGHAGALVAHRSGARAGTIEGASDPRSDGRAAGF